MGNKPQFRVKSRVSKNPNDREFNFKKMLRKWKNKYQEFGIREEINARRYYSKPSVIKRKMMNDTIRKHQRDLQKQKDNE